MKTKNNIKKDGFKVWMQIWFSFSSYFRVFVCWFNFCMIRRVLSYIMKPPLTKCFCMKVRLSSVWIGKVENGLDARSCVEMMELLPGIKMVYPFLYELKLCYLRRLFAFEVRYFGIREWKEKLKSGECYISVLVLCPSCAFSFHDLYFSDQKG